ncbi:hypothetical protein [Lacrimispora amygdalina]|uniref:hypothetical protein n=1 Tax=Lacrimispora amygdalina TaxID=253257 RepID=UPI000BE3C278|nr:hypothetical protein [Lacrimispora amygdalina]
MDERNGDRSNLENTLLSADDRAKYDAVCKCILKERAILARILKETVSEYANCSIEDIADKYIEPESISSETPVARNLTNINGLSEEDSTTNEGVVKFDVKFLAKSPSTDGKSLINLFIDVEAQKKYSVSYPIEKRAAYYCARMLSSQIGNIKENMNYNVLNKVYSIWVCFDVPKYAANTVSRYYYTKEDLLGKFNKIKESDYGLMETVIIRLSKDDTQIGNDLIDLLHGLFGDLEYEEKLERLDKLGLDVDLVRKEMDHMCNLSERIMERGIEQGIERGIERGAELAKRELALKMYKKGTPIRQISELTDIDVKQIEEWIAEKE